MWVVEGLVQKCLGARCQGPRAGGSRTPSLSLAISLQLVGELKEVVLVVDDLELAHVGLGLQVVWGGLHVQAWSEEGERWSSSRPPFIPYTHARQGRAKGVSRGTGVGRCPRQEWRTEQSKKIHTGTWRLLSHPSAATVLQGSSLRPGYSQRGRLRYFRIVLTFSATECWKTTRN